MVGPYTLTPTLTLTLTLALTLTLTPARHRRHRLQQDHRDEPRRPGGPSRSPIVHRQARQPVDSAVSLPAYLLTYYYRIGGPNNHDPCNPTCTLAPRAPGCSVSATIIIY